MSELSLLSGVNRTSRLRPATSEIGPKPVIPLDRLSRLGDQRCANRGAAMDVGGWLRKLGLEHYEAAFRENKIDDTVLPSLTAEDLKDLGVGFVGEMAAESIAARANGGGFSLRCSVLVVVCSALQVLNDDEVPKTHRPNATTSIAATY